MIPRNNIDAYQLGRDAFAEYSSLPALRFPLDENRDHNEKRWNSTLPINPFPKGKGSLGELDGFRSEWKRGWDEALHQSLYGDGKEENREGV
jgi:hypothetical protein